MQLDNISVQIPPTLAQLILSAVHHATLPIEELLTSLEALVTTSALADQACRPTPLISSHPPTDILHFCAARNYAGIKYHIMFYRLRFDFPPQAPCHTVLRSFLTAAATCEPLIGVEGVPCVWRVLSELAQKHGLSEQLLPELVSTILCQLLNSNIQN